MLVRLKPGAKVFRENTLHESLNNGENPIFRLYETPPKRNVPSREPYEGERPEDVPTTFEKWLGKGLEEVTDKREIEDFERSEANTSFSEHVQAQDYNVTLGRAGALAIAITQLDHGNDAHWLKDGSPKAEAVQEISGLENVRQDEVGAVAPTIRRVPQAKTRGSRG